MLLLNSFAALIAHANVKDAYRYYSATEGQQILRNRAGQGSAGQTGGLYREFMYAGIRFIEVRTVSCWTTPSCC